VKRALRILAVVLAAGGLRAGVELGEISFPTSGSPQAQPHFLRGALLLHSFQYPDAREEFQAAQKIDPGFALAYWGEAMTYNHPLWVEQDREAARAALARLAPTPEARLARASTGREKGFLRSVEALYGEGTKVTRDFAHAEVLERLFERYPADQEAATFYALALMGACQFERVTGPYMRAAAILEEVFAKSPKHPGAIHYLIHAYDDPAHAPLGLRAARVYPKVAGAASHAQHMPSHIFLALGMWDETVAANEVSFAVAEERVKRRGGGPRNFHSLQWLAYGYLQQGRYGEALKRLEVAEQEAARNPTASVRWHHAMMRAAWLVETRLDAKRRHEAAPPPARTDGVDLAAAAADLFATGLHAMGAGDRVEADKALAEMRTRRKSPSLSQAAAGCHTASYALTNSNGIKAADIMIGSLEALLRFSGGKRQEGLELAEKAAAAEDGLYFEYGPPIPVKPSRELLGEMQLQAGRPQEARGQFEKVLLRHPKRALSLAGLAQAADRSGDRALAERASAELRRVRSRAGLAPPAPPSLASR